MAEQIATSKGINLYPEQKEQYRKNIKYFKTVVHWEFIARHGEKKHQGTRK